MPSKSKPATTTQTSEPWAGAQPYLQDVMSEGLKAYDNSQANTYYPGSTVVPFSPQTDQSLNMIESRAQAGSPLLRSAQGQIQSTINGDYLDPTKNPAWGSASQDIINRVNSQFGAAGRTGSGGNEGVLTRELGNAAGLLYSGERQNQLNAANMAPQLSQADYYDAQMLGQTGAKREDLAGQYLQDSMDRFNYAQNQPWDNLNKYNALVQGFGGMGGTSTSSTPQYKNRLGGALGGAATGASIGSVIPGIGTGIGAGVGGLLGLLG